MTTVFFILAVIAIGLFLFALFKGERLAKSLAERDRELATLKQLAEEKSRHREAEIVRIKAEAEASIANALRDVEPLRQYQTIHDAAQQAEQRVREAEEQAQRFLGEAMTEVEALRSEAHALIGAARMAATTERAEANRRAKEIADEADALLDQATRDAGRMIDEAHRQAEQIGGDAYMALREKNQLEQAVRAIRNVIEGYGDRYIVPTRSVLDDLAGDFGHTAAGRALAAAREQTQRMVEEGHAAACDYAEASRRETAIRFIVAAFNGRVDAILSRSRHDNYGTLEHEIRDAFALVNLDGGAFRNARILPAYLDARLAELRWAVVVQELRLREREEQRRIREQIREEEKARRDYERAMAEAQRDEEAIKKALEKARSEVAEASADQRARFEEQIAALNQRLAEAEAKNQRALSMAQQTKAGNVYVISNVGSFGEEVFKVGMTRRLDPLDRIKELGDASVPFEFDVHAMIYSDDAPALERMLHEEFDALRVNKVNYRKEFFRLPLERLRAAVAAKGCEASFTMTAEAHEYRETHALEKMPAEEREKYHLRRALDEEAR